MYSLVLMSFRVKSLPSRGAWIEIGGGDDPPGICPVAPLAGSVDRNIDYYTANGWVQGKVAPLAGSVDRNRKLEPYPGRSDPSLPSRGAWIEILSSIRASGCQRVAPLAGSVDRNFGSAVLLWPSVGRSPRGERG